MRKCASCRRASRRTATSSTRAPSCGCRWCGRRWPTSRASSSMTARCAAPGRPIRSTRSPSCAPSIRSARCACCSAWTPSSACRTGTAGANCSTLAHIVVAHRPGWRRPTSGPLGEVMVDHGTGRSASCTSRPAGLHLCARGHPARDLLDRAARAADRRPRSALPRSRGGAADHSSRRGAMLFRTSPMPADARPSRRTHLNT